MPDAFTRSTIDRARWARRHNHGHPNPGWSIREQLAVALVLGDRKRLAEIGYTAKEAAQTIHDGMAAPPPDFILWIKEIRAEVDGQPGGLPTWNQIVNYAFDELSAARNAPSNARDWLNSDWRPVGSPLSDQAADTRSTVQNMVSELKVAIDRAKNVLSDAYDGTDE